MKKFLSLMLTLVMAASLVGCGAKKEEAPAAPTTKICPHCKSEIAIDATRCAHCTSEVE